jgi:hypothetical protein
MIWSEADQRCRAVRPPLGRAHHPVVHRLRTSSSRPITTLRTMSPRGCTRRGENATSSRCMSAVHGQIQTHRSQRTDSPTQPLSTTMDLHQPIWRYAHALVGHAAHHLTARPARNVPDCVPPLVDSVSLPSSTSTLKAL